MDICFKKFFNNAEYLLNPSINTLNQQSNKVQSNTLKLPIYYILSKLSIKWNISFHTVPNALDLLLNRSLNQKTNSSCWALLGSTLWWKIITIQRVIWKISKETHFAKVIPDNIRIKNFLGNLALWVNVIKCVTSVPVKNLRKNEYILNYVKKPQSMTLI